MCTHCKALYLAARYSPAAEQVFRKSMTSGVGTTYWTAPEIFIGGDYDEKVG